MIGVLSCLKVRGMGYSHLAHFFNLDKKSPIQITVYQTNAEKLVLNANLEKFNEAKFVSVQFFKENVENILKINQ